MVRSKLNSQPYAPAPMNRRLQKYLPALVLILGIGLSAASSIWLYHDIHSRAEVRFGLLAKNVANDISDHFHRSGYGLLGARGMYAAAPNAGPEEFRAYVQTRDIPKEFPGIRGFGVIERVLRADLDAYIARARATDTPAFAIRTIDDKAAADDLLVVRHIEPAGSNPLALGLDIGSEPNRRAAAQQAIDSGAMVMTGPIQLVQDNAKGAGVLVFVPFYRGGRVPPSVEARRQALQGLLYAPIVVAEMLEKIKVTETSQLNFSIFDSPPDQPGGALLYAEPRAAGPQRPAFTVNVPVLVPSRTLTLHATSTPSFDALVELASPWVFFATGLLVSSLLAWLLLQQASARRRAEALAEQMTQRLRAAQERAQDFSRSGSDWFWESDADHRFCYFSDNFETVYGISPDRLLGHTRRELLEQEKQNDPAALAGYYAQIDRHLPFRDFEYSVHDNQGRLGWVTVSGVPFSDADGHFAGYRGTGAIITARKAVEAELASYRDHLETQVQERTAALQEAKEAAEAANRAKTLFLGNMSHEMRTPLHQITGLAALFRRDPLTERQGARLELLESAATRLETVIGGILTLVSLESRTASVKLLPIEIPAILDEMLAMQQAPASAKKLALVSKVEPLPGPLLGDAGHLRTILACYIDNAITYCDRGTITVTASCVREDSGSALIRIAVSDEGPGIAPDDQARIFSEFEQVDNSYTRPFGGTGVGLSIVKKLATLLGGDAGCDSVPGQGSVFWVTLLMPKQPVLDWVSGDGSDFHI